MVRASARAGLGYAWLRARALARLHLKSLMSRFHAMAVAPLRCQVAGPLSDRDDGSTQPLIPCIFRRLACRRSRRTCSALAAGDRDRLAARDLMAGIVGHLPEEIT